MPGLGLILGGFGRIGAFIVKHLLPVIIQMISGKFGLIEVGEKASSCEHICKFDPELLGKGLNPKQINFEKLQPKRFKLIQSILFISFLSLIGVLVFEGYQTIANNYDLQSSYYFREKLDALWVTASMIIEMVIMWTLTGETLPKDIKSFSKK